MCDYQVTHYFSLQYLPTQLLKALPTRRLADIPILGAAFVPPTPVDVVGRAAARAALDPSVPGGIMDVVSVGESRQICSGLAGHFILR